ncbi:hypothetical protein [Bartonella sp. AP1QHHD]
MPFDMAVSNAETLKTFEKSKKG